MVPFWWFRRTQVILEFGLFYNMWDFTRRVSDCEELVGTISTKKAVSSKAIQLIYGSKGDMSRRKNAQRKARKNR